MPRADGAGAPGQRRDLTVPMRAGGSLSAASLYFLSGDYANAEAAERRVLALAPDEADRRQAPAKLRALATARRRATTLGRALYGDEPAGIDPVLAFFLMGEFARLSPAIGWDPI